jgi:hypothetical protein
VFCGLLPGRRDAHRSDSVISRTVSHVSKPSKASLSAYWERPSRPRRWPRSLMKDINSEVQRAVGSLIEWRMEIELSQHILISSVHARVDVWTYKK